VPFADVVEGIPGWSLGAVEPRAEIDRIRPLVQRYVDNVVPAPDYSEVSPKNFPVSIRTVASRQPADAATLLPVRSVNFFVNLDATTLARTLIDDLAEKLKTSNLTCVDTIEPVETVSILGGAIKYLTLRVRLAPEKNIQ
jgi:hypothetical protein